MYDLVIFDLDGTLYKYESERGSGAGVLYATKFHGEILERAREFVAKKLSITPEQAAKVASTLVEKYNGSISVGLQKDYGIKRSEYLAYVWDIDAVKYMNPDPELKHFISQIKITKALLTVAPEIWAKRALKRLGVYGLFDGMWFGDDDIRKPSREAYLRVASTLKAKPEKTIIIEDEPRYLKPAKEVGMTTVLIGSEEHEFVDYNIGSIYEAKKLIEP